MNRNHIAVLVAGSLLCACLSQSTLAHEEHPCKEDIKKFCADVKPGEGRIAKCLKEHKAELSTECKRKSEERREHAREERKEREGHNESGHGDKD